MKKIAEWEMAARKRLDRGLESVERLPSLEFLAWALLALAAAGVLLMVAPSAWNWFVDISTIVPSTEVQSGPWGGY